MILSDISVRRPVFATVLSLLLIIVGVMAYRTLPVREYPDTSRPIISIDTTYRGASAKVVETKLTQLIEDQLAGIAGLEKITSQSRDGHSEVTLTFDMQTDMDAAASDVRDALGRIADNLPEGVDPPEIRKVDSDARSVIWLTLSSDRLSRLELTDYAQRYLVDRFSTVNGVAQVRVSGGRRYAIRIWLDRQAMAARGLTVEDIAQALRTENVEMPAGRLESEAREFTLRTVTGFDDVQDFRELVVGRGPGGETVQLAEVARVELGAQNRRSVSRANGEFAVSLGITKQSQANTIAVSEGVRERLEEVRRTLPEGMELAINFDRATFIEKSIHEVYKALIFSLIMVVVVIYLFLGTVRAVIIPAVVVPISLLGSFVVMAVLGYSLNVLTLLGLVLAIGLVVDDAIVVLENIYRRIEDGQPPLLAAIDGSREISFAVIATTAVLIAAFVPISYMEGDIGRLFGEFGITVASAVFFSALVALTLTPMMTSRMFKGRRERRGFAGAVDRGFRKLATNYEQVLRRVIAHPWRILCAGGVVVLLAVILFRVLPSEYAPQEDRGVLFVFMAAPEGSSLEYTLGYAKRMEDILMNYVESGEVKRILTRIPGSWDGNAVDSARALIMLAPWEERVRDAQAIADEIEKKLDRLIGVQTYVFAPGGLGSGGSDRPVVVVLGGPTYDLLSRWSEKFMAFLEDHGGFTNIDTNFKQRNPQIRIRIDRARAADLGVSLATVGRTLATMMGGRIVTTFDRGGEEYNVILKAAPDDRSSPADLRNLYVRSDTTGQLIPLSSIVHLEPHAGADQLNHYNRLRAIRITAGLESGFSLGAAIDVINEYARTQLPSSIQLQYEGASKEYLESGYSLYVTFGLALLIVFLVLAAQFESFIHPLIIMSTVPLAITGGLIGLWLWGISINIFSQIGAILLVGLAAKNGVLIVEFANQLRDRGREFTEAIIEASGIRLRPVLMTSLAASFGALPLVLATGPGSESRRAVGVVVFCGVLFATFLTLFVVPAFYALIARNTTSPEHVSRVIGRLRRERGEAPVGSRAGS